MFSCVQDLAKAEAVVIIAAICARFDVSLAPSQVIFTTMSYQLGPLWYHVFHLVLDT